MHLKPNRSPWLLAAICTIPLAFCQPADAYVLGAGDGGQNPAGPSAALGATTYRVVIDPVLPLESYDARIAAHRAVGQEPQLVIGGTGTIDHDSSRGVVASAVAAAKRWPSAYAIGVINEPNESGMGVCEYDRTYLAAYRALRAVGVKRIPFGEWSPDHTLDWQAATLDPKRCHNSARRLARVVTRVAWHGYWDAIDYGPALAATTRMRTGRTPKLMVTEAGAVLRMHDQTTSGTAADLAGLRYWHHALKVAKGLEEIVAWDVHSPQTGAWDSGLIDGNGRVRPAFNVIASSR